MNLPKGMTIEDIMHRNELLRAEVTRLNTVLGTLLANLPADDLADALFDGGWECKKLPAKDWMLKYWGPKCEEFEPECCGCRAWKLFTETGMAPNANNLDALENKGELLKLRQENDFLKQHGRRMRIADAIVSSEQFMWLMVGSNHPESQRDDLRPAYEMWKQNGGVADLRKSVEALEALAKLDEELGLTELPPRKDVS